MATFREMTGGRWQARVHQNGKHESIGTFKTKKEAKIKTAEVERRIDYNESLINRHILFQEVIDDWFDHKEANVKGVTLEQIESVKRLYIEPFFSKHRLL